MPDRSTGVAAGSHPADGAVVMGTGRGRASELLEAGMDGDLDSWQEGLALACGVELGDGDRRRLALVGGPPPVALEHVLRRLATTSRPPGHVRRLRLLAERYRLALDGERDELRWVEAALGHPEGSLGRADLLGPYGLPLHVQELGAGLEPGTLPDGWLGRVGAPSLADVCRLPDEPQPVWVQLRDVGGDVPGG